MWYWAFRVIFVGIFKLFFQLKIEGLENIPQKTNFIIVANHSSFLDPLAVMAAVPKKIHCISLRYLYKIFWLRWFLSRVEAVPSGGASSEKALHLLAENKIVGLFPEGGVSRDGKLKEFKRGMALLAIKTGRPIVPCAIIGAYDALPLGTRFPKFRPIKVKIGKAKYLLKDFSDMIDDIHLQEGIHKIRNIVKEMIHAG